MCLLSIVVLIYHYCFHYHVLLLQGSPKSGTSRMQPNDEMLAASQKGRTSQNPQLMRYATVALGKITLVLIPSTDRAPTVETDRNNLQRCLHHY